MFHLSTQAWIYSIAGSLLIGLSKTGIAGIGLLAVLLFAIAFPSKLSVGIVLPVLIGCDIVAVSSYHKHIVWRHLLKLFPWAAIGVVIGYKALSHVNNAQVSHIIGALSIVLVALHLWRRSAIAKDPENANKVPHSLWFAASMGILAGFATMVANGAGPIMVLYLLAAGLPKMEFMGTGSVYFLIFNWFKVPFSVKLHLINLHSLTYDAVFIPIAIAGAIVGRQLLARINQGLFENVALVLTVVAGVDMLFKT